MVHKSPLQRVQVINRNYRSRNGIRCQLGLALHHEVKLTRHQTENIRFTDIYCRIIDGMLTTHIIPAERTVQSAVVLHRHQEIIAHQRRVSHIRSTAEINHSLLIGNRVCGGAILILDSDTAILLPDVLQQSIHPRPHHITAAVLTKIRVGSQIRILMPDTGLRRHTGSCGNHSKSRKNTPTQKNRKMKFHKQKLPFNLLTIPYSGQRVQKKTHIKCFSKRLIQQLLLYIKH